MVIPLVEQLQISKDEITSTAKKVNFMLAVLSENNLKEEYVTKIYEEWVTIAKRLKKGQQMIEQTERDVSDYVKLKEDARFIKLTNLYEFLLAILGYYDCFFKSALSADHHKKLQSAILEILR